MPPPPQVAHLVSPVSKVGPLRTRGGTPPEPILRDFKTIEVRDAVLAWDAKELLRDEHARPIARADAEDNKVPVYRYKNPKRPEWPDADYIAGNPPFVAGQNFREQFGDEYAEALWKVHPNISGGADLVMFWWDHAAELLTRKVTSLHRFGLNVP